MNTYPDEYYDWLLEGSRRSARVVVPIVMELVRPKRVVDVGCGFGTWLAVFRDHGAEEILGIDGEYVNQQRLEIAAHEFLVCDLCRPTAVERRFDLAVSLEVAEHLPEESADAFVAFLTTLAPVVLFSAAIPGQGGKNHVNEQWPEYWAARFEERRYRMFDYIRNRIWDSPDVEWWYAQNILLFSRAHIPAPPESAVAGETRWPGVRRVHPRQFLHVIEDMREFVRDRNAEIERLRMELKQGAARGEDVGPTEKNGRPDGSD
jgi:SAM-dependent methyltransferase